MFAVVRTVTFASCPGILLAKSWTPVGVPCVRVPASKKYQGCLFGQTLQASNASLAGSGLRVGCPKM